MLATSLGRLRVIGFIEGISYLALLFVAMPLKYMAGMPLAVRYVGWIHGVLFMLYVAALVLVWIDREWSLWKAGRSFAAAVIPFATFVIDREWKAEEQGETVLA